MDRWDCQTSATPEHCPLVMMKMVFCVRRYSSSYCMVLHGKVWYPTIDGGIARLIDRWYCMVWHTMQCIAMILNEANKWRTYNMIWGYHMREMQYVCSSPQIVMTCSTPESEKTRRRVSIADRKVLRARKVFARIYKISSKLSQT